MNKYCSHCGGLITDENGGNLCLVCKKKAKSCSQCAHNNVCKIYEVCGDGYVYDCKYFLSNGVKFPDDIEYKCPECGELLSIWYNIEDKTGHRNLIRHCDGCGRDYENEWKMGQETELRPKMWG